MFAHFTDEETEARNDDLPSVTQLSRDDLGHILIAP